MTSESETGRERRLLTVPRRSVAVVVATFVLGALHGLRHDVLAPSSGEFLAWPRFWGEVEQELPPQLLAVLQEMDEIDWPASFPGKDREGFIDYLIGETEAVLRELRDSEVYFEWESELERETNPASNNLGS